MGQSLKQELASVDFIPSKRLGQTFLIDKNILKKIIEAAELSLEDFVLEIGPGLGALTEELSAHAREVIAVEADKKLVAALREKFSAKGGSASGGKDIKNIKIIEDDFLKIDISKLNLPAHYKVVANLPYSITSAAIRKIMEADLSPSMAVLMVQKEVAKRICAKPGDMNLLALSVQYYSVPSFMFQVSRNCFWPEPKVDSAVIKIVMDKKRNNKEAEKFFQLARVGFSAPRKQLQNNLANGLHISKEKAADLLRVAGLDPKTRPEELGVEDWKRLVRSG